MGGNGFASDGHGGGGGGGGGALGGTGWRRPLPWAHLAEREVEEAMQTADGDWPDLLCVCRMLPDWASGRQEDIAQCFVPSSYSGEGDGGAGSLADIVDGGESDGAAPPGEAGAQPGLGAQPSEQLADSDEQQLPQTPEQLQRLRSMTAAFERDLACAARALRAVEVELSGTVPPDHSGGGSSRSASSGGLGNHRIGELGSGVAGLGVRTPAARLEAAPAPPRLQPWWKEPPEWRSRSGSQALAYAAFERRALRFARTVEGRIRAVQDWAAPFGWLPQNLWAVPPGCERDKDAEELKALLKEDEKAAAAAGPAWPDVVIAMYQGVRAAYAGAAWPPGAVVADADGVTGTAAAADSSAAPPGEGAEAAPGAPAEAAAPGHGAARVLVPEDAQRDGPATSSGSERKAGSQPEVAASPTGLKQRQRKPGKDHGGPGRAATPAKQLTGAERLKDAEEKHQAEMVALARKTCERVQALGAALAPDICSAAARRQLLQLLVWRPGDQESQESQDLPATAPSGTTSAAAAAVLRTGRGAAHAGLLSLRQRSEEEQAAVAEAEAEEKMVTAFVADMRAEVKERWRWVLTAAVRGHKAAVQVAGRALAGALLLHTLGAFAGQLDPVLCAGTILVMALMQAPEPAPTSGPVPFRVYSALLTGPLPPPPQCLWAELRSSAVQQALTAGGAAASPLSNAHLVDTALRLINQPAIYRAWVGVLPGLLTAATDSQVDALARSHARLVGLCELEGWRRNVAFFCQLYPNSCNPFCARRDRFLNLDWALQLSHLPVAAAAAGSPTGPARVGAQMQQQQQQQQQQSDELWRGEVLDGLVGLGATAALVLMSALHDRGLPRHGAAATATASASASASGGGGAAAGSTASSDGEAAAMGAMLEAARVASRAALARRQEDSCAMLYTCGAAEAEAQTPAAGEQVAQAPVADAGGGGAVEGAAQAGSGEGGLYSASQPAATEGHSAAATLPGGSCGRPDCLYCGKTFAYAWVRRAALPSGAVGRLESLAARLPVAARVLPDSRLEQVAESVVRAFGTVGAGHATAGAEAGAPDASASAASAPAAGAGAGAGAVARLHCVGVTGCQRLLTEVLPEVRRRMAAHGRDVGLVPVVVLDYGACGGDDDGGGGGRGGGSGGKAACSPLDESDCVAGSAGAAGGAGGMDAGGSLSLAELDGDYRLALHTLLPMAPLQASAAVVQQVKAAVDAWLKAEPAQPQQHEPPAVSAAGVSADDAADRLEEMSVGQEASQLTRALAFAHDGGQPLRRAYEDALTAQEVVEARLGAVSAAEAAEVQAQQAAGRGRGPRAGNGEAKDDDEEEGSEAGPGVEHELQVQEEQLAAEGAGAVWRGRQRLLVDVLLLECVLPSPQQQALAGSGILSPGAWAFLAGDAE
ncbi:hypothetical protein HXX76_006393 [Chlamydomonas incerta]|uniref:Uncharacterized protein n=1 Tax=Chlamydomonas incerta TaxID=51695 RepID=A0A835W4D9_CHLIN|nr:hypothetical protein HXX76_006393 [Chlamydomonas incerta]|eukprot:KAG2436873.1 hypothetical protein HXX76_006393 [Chlamydomonas incerta]